MKLLKRNKPLAIFIIVSVSLLLLVLVVIFMKFVFSNEIALVKYSLKDENGKGGFRVIVISDLHDDLYGEGETDIISRVEESSPDLVLFAGDMTEPDSDHENMRILMTALAEKYPCYYSSGNHEQHGDTLNFESIKKLIESTGVKVLDGDTEFVKIRGREVAICGVDNFSPDDGWQNQIDACLGAVKDKENTDTILISHRPDLVKRYKEYGFDLVVCGHAHGGQVRIPGILNGLYAPNQGIFPKYAGGYYNLKSTEMIVSRGLCKSRFPRVFNRPEIVVIDIGKDKQ